MSGITIGSNPEPGVPVSAVTVVAESRQQVAFLFGFLGLVFAAALARGVTGAHTSSGRVATAVVFGVLLAVILVRWVAVIRRPARLEITADAIRYVPRDGQVASLSRQAGDELRFVQRRRGLRTWTLELTIAGTDAGFLLIGFFSRDAVRRACRAHGWRFDDKVTRLR